MVLSQLFYRPYGGPFNITIKGTILFIYTGYFEVVGAIAVKTTNIYNGSDVNEMYTRFDPKGKDTV